MRAFTAAIASAIVVFGTTGALAQTTPLPLYQTVDGGWSLFGLSVQPGPATPAAGAPPPEAAKKQ